MRARCGTRPRRPVLLLLVAFVAAGLMSCTSGPGEGEAAGGDAVDEVVDTPADDADADEPADEDATAQTAVFVAPPSVLAVLAEREPPPPPESRDLVAGVVRRLVEAGVSQLGDDARLGVLVVDEHGRELASHDPDRALLPASTLKIVTAAAALLTFGPDARLTTAVEVTAPVDPDGVLRGDLVLVGGGDPVLVTDEYARWVYPARPRTSLTALADELAASGLQRVAGDLVGVSDRFPGERAAPGWPDRYFSSFDARYSDGLTVDAGLRTILTYPEPEEDEDAEEGAEDVEAGETEDDPADATADVAEDGAPVEDDADGQAAADADADDADADEEADEEADEVDPEELGPPEVRVDHAADPREQATAEFARLLEERGIEISGDVRVGEPEGASVGRLARVHSPPMEELLRFAVQRSDNQITDGLFRAVARARTGEGSWEQGDRALRQVLDRLGVDHTDAVFADGSGLSRDDRVTVRLLVDLDRAVQATRHAATWRSLMAVTGESGTLEGRLRGTIADGRFGGKTGTLRDVSGLSGTVVDVNGVPRYHLAMVVNSDNGNDRWVGRTIIDELILALVADLDGCEIRLASGIGPLGRAPMAPAC